MADPRLDRGDGAAARIAQLEEENRRLRRELQDLWNLEESARRGEHRLRELVDGTGSFISQVDGEGRFVFVNRAAERVLGLPPLQCIGLRAIDFVHPADREEAAETLGRWVAERRLSAHHESRIVSRDGKVSHLLSSLELRYDNAGRLRHVSSIARDVTELRRAEGDLRESERKYRTLVDDLNVGVFRMEAKDAGRLLFANRALLRMIGHESFEDAARRPFEALFVRTEDRAALRELVSRGESALDLPVEIGREDGTTLWASCSAVPSRDASGRLLHVDGILEDITERKRAEKAILESEERWRRLSDAAFEGIAITERGRTIDVNRRLAEMYGYAVEEMVGRDALDFIAPESRELVRERMLAGLEGSYEHLALHHDGSTFPIEVHAKTIHLGGRPARITAIRDITERKRSQERQRRAEVALRESEEKYRTLVDNLQVGVFRVTPGVEGRLVFANQALIRMSGYADLEELNRKALPEHFVRPEDRAALADLLASRARPLDVPLELKRKDGTGVWVSCSVVAATDASGQVRHVDGIIEDITERKRAEDAILESEERFRMLSEAGLEGICIIDQQTARLADANGRLAEMLGYDLEDLVGRDVMELIGPESEQEVRERLVDPRDEVIRRQLRRRDGSTFPAETRGRSMRYEGREVRIVTVRDVSEQQRVEDLQESLRRAETMSVMGRLVGGVAHEVRNPLFAISATLDAFEEDFRDHPEYGEYARLLRVEVDRLRRLMQDLLDYGRPTVTTFAPGAIGPLVKEAVEQVGSRARKAGVQLAVEGLEALPEVEMDRQRLHLVFVNLVKNAVAYTPEGGRVSVTAEAFEESGEDWVRCRVEDEGAGIAEGDLPRLFEPFFTRRKGGTGLGLSIVQRVVEEHAGRVQAGNRPEGGAVLRVELPCRPPRGREPGDAAP